jgi:hypothetical protein
MIICPHCGVEVQDASAPCPLCQRPLTPDADTPADRSPARPGAPHEARRRVRRWLVELLTLLAVVGSAVVLVIDLATGRALDWAHYPLASIWFLWLATVAPQFLRGRSGAILTVEFATAAAYLAVLDRFTSGPTWFLPLALPMTVLAAALLAATLAFIRRPSRSPFAAIAAALLAAGALAVGVELLLNRFLDRGWHVAWSLVVLGCVLPLVAVLLYLRTWYRQRQDELRKLLHL